MYFFFGDSKQKFQNTRSRGRGDIYCRIYAECQESDHIFLNDIKHM